MKPAHPSTTPALPWERVIGRPIRRLLETHDGTEGACYTLLGIEFNTGDVLNLDNPALPFPIDDTTATAMPSHDLRESAVDRNEYVGRSLQSLIYCLEDYGGIKYRRHFAVLDHGGYLTSYPSFNCTEVAFGFFREWQREDESRLTWGAFRLQSQSFYNAWTDGQVDPFAISR